MDTGKNEKGEPLVGNARYLGYCADLAKEVAELVNFEYIIRPVRDKSYGRKDENETWDGMVGELVRNVSTIILNLNLNFVFRHIYSNCG